MTEDRRPGTDNPSSKFAPRLPFSAFFPLNSATRILIWLAFALSLPWLHTYAMLGVSLLLVPVLLIAHRAQFIKLLRRTRWLLLSIIFIYAWATPGENLIEALGEFGPTFEGLQAGAVQAWRLAILLAGLALLLATTPGKQLLGGMYLLLRPWGRLGATRDRIAARVWLTLYYAEHTVQLKPREWRAKLQHALATETFPDRPVTFEVQPFAWRDWLVLALTALTLGALLR